jgi:hypothetical protein
MSKKIIAVAAAAALALTGLVGIAPANASVVVTFGINDAAGTGIAAFTPGEAAASAAANIVVPADNTLTFTDTAARSSLARVTVTTDVGETVTATSTGALKILDLNGVGAIGDDYRAETTAGVDYTSASGTQTFSMVATTTSVVFYVYTTSTTAASLTVNKSGNTRVVWIEGAAGSAYNVALTTPTFVAANTTYSTDNVTAKVTDVFGNSVENSTGVVTLAVVGNGAVVDDPTPDWSATNLNYGSTATTTGSGTFGISAYITTAPTDVTGLAVANDSVFVTVNSGSAATQVTALEAQVAALTAQVAAQAAVLAVSRLDENSVTQKKYNTLVRKWNAAFPSQRVALKQ